MCDISREMLASSKMLQSKLNRHLATKTLFRGETSKTVLALNQRLQPTQQSKQCRQCRLADLNPKTSRVTARRPSVNILHLNIG